MWKDPPLSTFLEIGGDLEGPLDLNVKAVLLVNNEDQIFINNVEDFQVVFKDDKGAEVTNVNSLAGKPGIQNQLRVKTIEIYLTVRSRNKVYKSENKN